MWIPAMGCRSLFTVFDALSCPLRAPNLDVRLRQKLPQNLPFAFLPGRNGSKHRAGRARH